MKKLYLYFTFFLVILLCGIGIAQGMETFVITHVDKVRSLKKLCLYYLEDNAQEVNLIDNLASLPADLAAEALLFPNSTYIDQNKMALVELVQSNRLDIPVSCVIAQRIEDIPLIYELAKNEPITEGVAAIIIKDLFNSDITACLSDFGGVFNKVFPKEILDHGNYDCFYRVLMNEVINYPYYSGDWKKNEAAIFSAQDFEHNLSIEKIANYAANKYFTNKDFDKACATGIVTFNPGKNFLAFGSHHIDRAYYGSSEIHNLKTGSKIIINNPSPLVGIDKIVFSQDCSYFGILDKDGSIHSIEVTPMLFNKNISLQKLASLVYYWKQLYKKRSCTYFLKELIDISVVDDEKEKLIAFTNHKAADIQSLPIHISNHMKSSLNELEKQWTIIYIINFIADTLHTTKKEILTKCLIDIDPQYIENVEDSIRNNFDIDTQIKFQQAMDQYYGLICSGLRVRKL